MISIFIIFEAVLSMVISKKDIYESSSSNESFEITEKDLLGRIGKLTTKSGCIETPCLLPVINISKQPISLEEIFYEFDCNAIMTNAYLLKRNFEQDILEKGIHKFLKFNGIIFTDSGAYQMLTYGKIDVEPLEIINFEEGIGSDIAVILDFPTGIGESRKKAEMTVNETLKRGDEALRNISRKDILWVGPVQGGKYIDLVEICAKEMGKRDFSIYALGSPTKIMESYKFETLFEMVFAAKSNLPLNKPFHLFGAGHPFMLSLAVASGCDMFDSAAYVIFARDGRYLTDSGTSKIENMKYFPCSCPVCIKYTPKSLLELDEREKIGLLSKHNLHTCIEEIKRIKEAIIEGRLWELLEIRTKSHPSLLQALKSFEKYSNFLEENTPSTKKSGIFYFGKQSSIRPEIIRYKTRILKDYKPLADFKRILFLPAPINRPYNRNKFLKLLIKEIETLNDLHICLYTFPYGLIPIEICDMFPLSQTETVKESNHENSGEILGIVTNYLKKNNYKEVTIHADRIIWDIKKLILLSRICKKKGINFRISYHGYDCWNRKSLQNLFKMFNLHPQQYEVFLSEN